MIPAYHLLWCVIFSRILIFHSSFIMRSSTFALSAFTALASAYDLPDNLKAIYDAHKVSLLLLTSSARLI